jgi:hypothetical protein
LAVGFFAAGFCAGFCEVFAPFVAAFVVLAPLFVLAGVVRSRTAVPLFVAAGVEVTAVDGVSLVTAAAPPVVVVAGASITGVTGEVGSGIGLLIMVSANEFKLVV